MKRVLFVVHTLQMGGAEKVLLNLLKNLNKEKYDITVLAIVNDGIYIDELKKIEKVKYRYVFPAYFQKSRTDKEAKYHKLSNKVMNYIWRSYLRKIKYQPKKIYQKGVGDDQFDNQSKLQKNWLDSYRYSQHIWLFHLQKCKRRKGSL